MKPHTKRSAPPLPHDREHRGFEHPASRPITSADDMATEDVPDEIRDFILEHIASVAQIEALLLIWSNPEKRWGVSRVAARIYVGQVEAAEALNELAAHGLLVREDEAFGLCASEENVEMIGRLKDAYARHLIPVTDVIHGKSRDRRPVADTRGLAGDR